jgi:hypothetical protein
MTDTLMDSIIEVIKDLYIYGDLVKDNDDISENVLIFIEVINILLLVIFCLNFFKLFLIFIFFLYKCFRGMMQFVKYVFRHKFCVNYCKEFKNCLIFLGKIVKKMFTYCFYSYENKFQGFFMYSVYFTFISVNLIFNFVLKFSNNKNEFQLLQLFACETTLLIEILVISFYISRKFKIQMIILWSSFLSLNAVLGFGLIFKLKYLHATNYMGLPNYTLEQSATNEYLKTLANIIFLLYFTIMYIIALYEVFVYDTNSI